MDQGSSRNVARTSNEPTAASILGVKGQLCFRPHGSTQKAHVVLRQVALSEDSEDEGDPSMIYFSLFAQKRIEVKPGKEILLAVATPDGKFLDTPVIFAGRLSGDDTDTGSSKYQATERHSTSAGARTLPPKMRKTWSKRSHVQTTNKSTALRSYTSVGIQAGTSMIRDDTTTAPPSPMEDDQSSLRERSLSPMELDSAPSSPSIPSPEPLPDISSASPRRTKSTSFSPPGLWVSASSPQPQRLIAEANIPPLDLSPDSEEPPGLSFTPITNLPRHLSPKTVVVATQVVDDRVNPLPPPISTANAQPILASPSNDSVASTSLALPLATFVDANKSAPTPTSAPYIPKRKTVPNPFVSGGLLTDFVSSAAAKKVGMNTKEGHVNGSGSEVPSKMPAVASPPSKSSQTDTPVAATPPVVTVNGACSTPAAQLPPSPPSTVTSSHRSRSPEPSASPSSSKVKVEDLLPHPQAPAARPLASSYNGPIPFPFMPPRYPPLVMPNFPPNLTQPPPHLLARGVNGSTPLMSNTPPDPRSLAYLPTSSYNNPLNIRPAPNLYWAHEPYDPTSPMLSPPVQIPPALTTPAAKKPLPIGSGWPYNREANGHARRPSLKMPANAPQPPLVPPIPTPTASPSTPNNLFSPPVNFVSEAQVNDYKHGESHFSVHSPQNDINGPLQSQTASLDHENQAFGIPVTCPSQPLSRTDTPAIPNISRPSSVSSAHPLPPRPLAFAGPAGGTWSPHTGVKRMGSPTLQAQSPETRRSKSFNWPASDAVYSLRLQSDDDAGIRTITHNSDGSLCAVTCFDKSVRIFSTKTRTELAKLAHNMQVTAVAWMERDAGIITLGDNGIVSTWTRSAGNKWQWAKILDASGDRRPDDEPGCLAFGRDRIAIAFPKSGVKVWLFIKGTWLPQRSILRQNVTAIKFVEDGEALIGGTTDGVLWYCQVPNGTLRAYSFMKSKVYALDVDSRGDHALATQTGGRSHLVNISQDDQKGKIEQVYFVKDSELQNNVTYDFGALFASRGRCLLFGVTRGCIMVWDRKTGEITHGLNHGEEYTIQAISCFDGSQAVEGHILTGTRQGHLTWFSQPPVDGNEGRPTW